MFNAALSMCHLYIVCKVYWEWKPEYPGNTNGYWSTLSHTITSKIPHDRVSK